jgi:hypothetical protein
VTRTEEVKLWWHARRALARPDPARRELAWKVIWTLFRVARDPAVHARALSMVEERTDCVWLTAEDRAIVAVRPSATICRIPVARTGT